ncbi:MAG TPA: N-acetylmuramoyl-L-alanine amidase [Thermoanaerobaculia bacterium]|nr:N-acetylmuramoyl-L-alanine amidase [Thermoanaerobaculia bacterium]
MATTGRLRQSILKDAIRENVDVIEGRLPRGLRRSDRWPRLLFRTLVFVVVPLALFLSLNVLTTGRGERTDVLVVSSPSAAPAAPASVINPPNGLEPSLFHLEVRSVVIDPGHGGADPGATASGVAEKDVTLDVARRLRKLLVAQKVAVSLTREGDTTLSLRDRVVLANSKKADLFVSIHVNSLPAVKEKRGVETYFLGTTTDPHVQRLALDENRASGYTMADFRRLLEGVLADSRQGESRKFAEAVQGGLVTSLRPVVPRLEDRGVRSAPFVVLIATEMPGILAEVSTVSNEDEARRLGDPRYRQQIARALSNGILAYAESRNHPPSKRS